MTRSRYADVLPYLAAAAIVATAVGVRMLLDPILQNRQPFAAFLVAVLIAGRYCGFGPSLLAVFLSATASRYFFVSPRGSLTVPGSIESASLCFFMLIGAFCSLLMRAEQRIKQRLQQEIAERKRIEAELRASEDRFHRFMDNGPFAAFMKDEAGKYVYINRLVEQITQLRRADHLGKTDPELFSPEVANMYLAADARAFQENNFVHSEETVTSADGVLRHWSTIKFPLHDGQGRRLLGGVSVDVTEMLKAEQKAKNSEARLLLALEAGRMGYWSWDLSTNCVLSSETQAVIHGRSPDQTLTRIEDSDRNIHPDDRQRVQEVISRAIRNEAPERITYRVVWADGGVHWIEAVGRVFCDELGIPKQVMGVCVDITERKTAENALRESEERFRLLAMHAPVGIALCDVSGRTLFVNPKSCEMVGASAEEVMGFDWQDFIHPDDRGRLLESWRADIAAGRIHSSAEFRFAHKDGTVCWAAATASLIRDADGTPIGQIGITEDVTERRKAETRFRDIYEQAPLGIGLIDSNTGRFLQINPKYEQIIGRTAKEMLNLTFQEITFPEDLAADLDNMALLRAGTIRRFQMQKRLLRGDGSVMWANLTVVPMWQAGETPTYHLAMVEDVTERKNTEDKLRERESQLSGILDNTTAFIYLKDAEGRYLLTNRRHQNLLQQDGKSILGKTDVEFFPEPIARTFLESDAKVWREQAPADFEEVALQPDGPRTYRSIKFPVRDEAGRMIALGGISTDITDLKEANAALVTKQELLRSLIEVQENEKQLLCREFHDGLIQYVVASLMLLERQESKHPATEDSPVIQRVIANLRRGVDDGRRVIRGIRPAVLDDSGLEAAIVDLIWQYENSGILVTSHCDPDIGRLSEMIQTTVYRVVQEALNNAKKYSGTDAVRIELKKVDDELQLVVQDFGRGFDVQPARRKGFGLLGMTERVRLLGGECLIQSEPGVGTRISVRLPITE